ncbi:MAG: DoxX family membrane protein [Sphingobacteriaceae bacterium]|nr:MAG: DoxX family membrane protein [Sphingobacteriaceae bacterium]
MDRDLTTSNWSFLQKLLFRLFFLIYALIIVVFRNGTFPFFNSIYNIILKQLQNFVLWMGALLLNGKVVTQPTNTGSGDTTYNYILLLGVVLAAVIGTIIWSLLDRNRPNYQKLFYYLSVLVRYYLGFFMLSYGLAKLFNMQFGDLSEYRLKSTYGQSSPMGLAWTFFSYSTGYKYFMGIAEALGGLLLLFRRTVALGAVITLTVTANIVAVNYFFDVPVKILSTILLSMSVFLILKDAKRFFNFFLLNKATEPANLGYFSGKNHNLTISLLKYALIIYLVVPEYINYSSQKNYLRIYGKFQVESMKQTNLNTLVSNSDSVNWKNIEIKFDSAKVQLANNRTLIFSANIDQVNNQLILFADGNIAHQYQFTYAYTKPDRLVISSINLPNHKMILFKLRKSGVDYPLTNRGFHWINEYPYNK